MKPVLFGADSTEWVTKGIGVLSDAIRCEVTEELNGVYEMEIDYPMAGIHFNSISARSIILVKPNPFDNAQPFRVYKTSKPMNGVVTFYGRHISYDLDGIICDPFTADDVSTALTNMKSAAVSACPFVFSTDKTTEATMKSKQPETIRGLMSGQDGSILDIYGGEYSFDGLNVYLNQRRGADRGFSVRYGKNLTNLKQEENLSNCYTGIYPYWYKSEDSGDTLVYLPERVIPATGDFDYTRIKPVDLSDKFENAPTVEELRSAANRYVENNAVGIPHVNITVSFAQIGESTEYSAIFERVCLGDDVSVFFPKLGIYAHSRCVSTVYDPLRDRYKKIELERIKNTLEAVLRERITSIRPGRSVITQSTAGLATAESVEALAAVLENSIPVRITRQPQNRTAHSGDTVTVSVTAVGTDLHYQWYIRGTGDTEYTKTGDDSSTISITVVENKQVYCVVSDDRAGYKVATRTATITVEE